MRLRLALSVALLAAPQMAAPLVASAAPPATAPRAAEREPVLDRVIFTNANIHVGDGTVIEGGSILIEGGKIARIERTAITGVDRAVSVDLAGKLVTPGLIAADTEIGLVEISLEDSTHDDSRRDPSPIKSGYDPSSAINADSSVIAIQAIEGVTTAAVAPRGGVLSGGVAWIDLLAGAHTTLVAATAVAVVGNLGRSHDGSRAAALTELRRAFEDARWYRQNERNYERNQTRELAAHPLDLRALWPVLDKQIPLIVRAHRASDLLALIQFKADFGVELTIIGACEGWKVAAELAAADVTVVIQPSDNLPGNFDSLGARLDNAKLLHEAGVRVAIAHFDSHNARNITQEAGLAVASGLPHAAALTAVTLNVARAYGMEDQYGSLAVGKVANLVIWDGADPFELSCWAQEVWIRGRKLDMSSRQTQLRDRYMDLGTFAE
jgi:imidazolonepropionase-like amidohydrolase